MLKKQNILNTTEVWKKSFPKYGNLNTKKLIARVLFTSTLYLEPLHASKPDLNRPNIIWRQYFFLTTILNSDGIKQRNATLHTTRQNYVKKPQSGHYRSIL